MLSALGILCCMLMVAGCASDKKDLPNTPETVARQWQQWIDNNQYQQARELSTTNGIAWIDWVETTLKNAGVEEDAITPSRFLAMQCKETQSSATCRYLLDDNGVQYHDSFLLQKIAGQWLVDIPDQDLIEDETIDELFKELERMEKETAQ